MWNDPHYLLADARQRQREIERDVARSRKKRSASPKLCDVVNVWIDALRVTAAYVCGHRPEPTL